LDFHLSPPSSASVCSDLSEATANPDGCKFYALTVSGILRDTAKMMSFAAHDCFADCSVTKQTVLQVYRGHPLSP
jgi:hypothetical protein